MDAADVAEIPAAPAREWTPPQIECYETRPEVTAYAGGDGPWANH